MGRPKESAKIQLLKDKHKKSKEEMRKRLESEPDTVYDGMEIPDWLPKQPKVIQEEFEWYRDELAKLEILGNVDKDTLGRFIVTQYQYSQVSKALTSRVTNTTRLVNNIDEINKLTNAQSKLLSETRQYAQLLGLSINSRGRITLPKTEEKKEQSAEEKLFGGL